MSRVAILDDNKTWLRALRAALVGKKVIRIEELNGCPNIITEPEDTEEAGQNEIGQKRKNMKKFNLEEALQGKPVVTRDGRKVSQLVHFKDVYEEYSVYAVLAGELEKYTKEGKFLESASGPHSYDLFMESAKREGWVNIYDTGLAGTNRVNLQIGGITTVHSSECVYRTHDTAVAGAEAGLIATVRIEWEE